MRTRLLATLFALPFAGFGGFMLWSLVGMAVDASRMTDWRPTPADLEDAGYHVRDVDDAETYEVYARYRYRVDGRDYTGTRVGLGSWADNLGDYHRDLGTRLAAARARSEAITVYVNPEDPTQAIIDRTLRWGLIGFQSVFVLLFGGFGVGLLLFTWRPRAPTPEIAAGNGEAPWLANPDWQSPDVRSSSRAAMWAAVGFATLWNLVSAPLPFIVWQEVVGKGNHAAAIALLFPLVGVGLAIWAIRRTGEWRRFGAAPVLLDPFPGAIGGHVGGTVALTTPLPHGTEVAATLTCLRSYVAGSGKDRGRREDVRWQDSRSAHLEPAGRGTRISFRFEVPGGLPEADARRDGDSYHLWRLNLRGRIPGADLDRDYDLPVYATALRSAALPDSALRQADDRHRRQADTDVADLIRVDRSVLGNRLAYPIGRHLAPAIGGVVFGLAFAGIGGFFLTRGDSLMFGLVFGGVGLLIALASAYLGLNSLEVCRERGDIVSVRRVLGIRVSRQRMSADQIVDIEPYASMTSTAGGRHTITYSLRGVDRQGHRITLGDGFRGESRVQAGMRLIIRELDLGTLPDTLDLTGAGH